MANRKDVDTDIDVEVIDGDNTDNTGVAPAGNEVTALSTELRSVGNFANEKARKVRTALAKKMSSESTTIGPVAVESTLKVLRTRLTAKAYQVAEEILNDPKALHRDKVALIKCFIAPPKEEADTSNALKELAEALTAKVRGTPEE